jgi:hypothetical protein
MGVAGVANTVVVIAVVVLVLAALVATSVQRVRPNEWLVVARMGSIERSARKGPSIALLLPFLDHGIRISAAPQRIEVKGVPGFTCDGHGVQADVDVRFQVVDPVAFAYAVPTPAAVGVRILARRALAEVVAPLELGDALARTAVEDAFVQMLERQLAIGGARDFAVRLTHIWPATVSDADEQAALVRLGARWARPDPDESGPHTLRGDLAWAVHRVGRMARWEPLVVVAATVGFQFLGLTGVERWSPVSLFAGVVIGVFAAPVTELRSDAGDVVRKAGCRRAVIWGLAVVVWTIATLAVVFGVGLAAGLDKVRV